MQGYLIYLLVFVGKVVEVALMTMRIVLISKGEKKIGSFIAFFEISLWLIIIANVLSDLSGDPVKAIVYALGFIVGNYVGSLLESWIGIGTAQVQVIVKKEFSENIINSLYDNGYAYTMIDGQGKHHARAIIYTMIPRKTVKKAVKIIKECHNEAFITVHETKPYMGGFGLKRK